MRARVVAVAVITTALLGTTVSTGWAQHRYHDVSPDHPHYEAIERLSEAGIAEGDGKGYFHPQDEVTRGQVATLIATASHMETTNPPPFEDVPADHPHAQGITATAESGVVSGYEDGTFRPQRSVSRGQMATILADAYRLEAEGDTRFDDVGEGHPHAAGVAALAEHDVAEGFRDGTYRPEAPVTRGQMAAFLTRADPQL